MSCGTFLTLSPFYKIIFKQIKTLGDVSDDESAANWVERSRQNERVIKQEKELSSVADEFGVSDLIKKEFKEKQKDYTEKDLKVWF